MADILIRPSDDNTAPGSPPLPMPFRPRSDGGLVGYVNVGTGEYVTPTDISGSIINGGTAQQLVPADDNRRLLLFVNSSPSDLYINVIGEAGDGIGLPVAPSQSIEFSGDFCPRGAVSVWGGTTGQRFNGLAY